MVKQLNFFALSVRTRKDKKTRKKVPHISDAAAAALAAVVATKKLRRVSPRASRSTHTVTFMFPANMSEPIVSSLLWIRWWFLKRYELVTPR